MTSKLNYYSSICELGCFNGRISLILREQLKDKKYVGYDINFLAIFIAKLISFLNLYKKNYFHCKNAIYSYNEKCELFVSVATIIYFSEFELKKFISYLKKNKFFKCLVIHEMFLDENVVNENISVADGNLNIHSVKMIGKEFGNDYALNFERTFYENWEKKGVISGILSIKKH